MSRPIGRPSKLLDVIEAQAELLSLPSNSSMRIGSQAITRVRRPVLLRARFERHVASIEESGQAVARIAFYDDSVLECLHSPASIANGNCRHSTMGQGFSVRYPSSPSCPETIGSTMISGYMGNASTRRFRPATSKSSRENCTELPATGSIERSYLCGFRVAAGLGAEGLGFDP